MNLLYANVPWATFMIDLKQPLPNLWNNIKKETRKNIRRLERNEKIVVKKNEHDKYYDELVSARQSQGLKTSSKENFDKLKLTKGYANFLVEFEGLVVGGIGLVPIDATTVKEQASFRTVHDKFNSQDLLKWHIITYAKERGYEWFDLAGVHPNPVPGSKEETIRRFKEKFGGQYRTILIQRNRLGLLAERVGLL